MDIVLIGINHKTAPVEVRERLAFPEAALGDALSSLVDHHALEEGLIVSTCNRVELLASAPSDAEQGINHLTSFLCKFHSLTPGLVDAHLYRHQGAGAVRHIFRVASSLDSLVVGEPQILGQVKDAYHSAVQAGTIGRILSQLMDRTLSVAKRVRNETGISLNPVSVSSVAVELSRKVFGDLSGKTVLLIGAGEMAEIAARNLMDEGTRRLLVSNRTAERAQSLAMEFNGEVAPFQSLYDVLPSVDIVLCSTGAPEYVVRAKETASALKARRKGPILFIDISVPRNVDPGVSGIENCYLFDVDDLDSVVQSNRLEREREAAAAEVIIESEVVQFLNHLRTLDIGPSIVEVKELIHEIVAGELRRNRKKLNLINAEQEQQLREILIPALVNKLTHPIILHMRAAARNGDRQHVLDELRKLIRLD